MPPLISRSEPIKACKLSIEEIKKLYNKLALSAKEAGEAAISSFTQDEKQSNEEFAQFKSQVLSAYIISVVIRGSKGELLVEGSENIFSSPNLPNKITNIYFDSVATHKARYNNIMPAQWFTLNLDFSAPRLLDWENALSGPTPNASTITIEGNNETWVAGVLHKVNETMDNNATSRNFLHKAFTYDAGLWFLGFSFAFYLTSKATSHIDRIFVNGNKFIIWAAHFYVFIFSILLYRVFYGYTKWAFPKVELDDGKGAAKRHRRFWWVWVLVPVIGILQEVFKNWIKSLFK